jgi:hypothetical protein
MHRTRNFFTGLLLSASIVAPAAVFASPAPPPASQEDRGIYDREHKDYHKWDDHEQSAWGRFLAEKHRKDHDFAKAKRKEQEEYWAWRHSHPD